MDFHYTGPQNDVLPIDDVVGNDITASIEFSLKITTSSVRYQYLVWMGKVALAAKVDTETNQPALLGHSMICLLAMWRLPRREAVSKRLRSNASKVSLSQSCASQSCAS